MMGKEDDDRKGQNDYKRNRARQKLDKEDRGFTDEMVNIIEPSDTTSTRDRDRGYSPNSSSTSSSSTSNTNTTSDGDTTEPPDANTPEPEIPKKSPVVKYFNSNERKQKIREYNAQILRESRQQRLQRRRNHRHSPDSEWDDSSDTTSIDSESPKKKKRVSFEL